MGPADGGKLDRLLDEQAAYYNSIGGDLGKYAVDIPGSDELAGAFEAFRPAGRVLEFACGTGTWTGHLLRHATDVTALDASPEMLAAAAARVGNDRVRFIQADLFTWVPDRRYDVVFIGFWLSHVPLERFAAFWALVGDCLTEDGRVFFADDAYRTPEELIEGPSSSTISRRLLDGSTYRIVKVPHEPAGLEQRLRALGWDITVSGTPGGAYWGSGGRARNPRTSSAMTEGNSGGA